MKIRARGGFTYIEVVLSLALFLIALAALLPTIAQAGRNATAARDMYVANRRAYQLMLLVRDESFAGARDIALDFSAQRDNFPFRIFFVQGDEVIYTVQGGNSPTAPPPAFDFTAMGHRRAVAVTVYSHSGYIIGRALGVKGADI